MAFTNKEFPGQLFKTVEELENAKSRRKTVEQSIAVRSASASKPLEVVATIIPAAESAVERRVLMLEDKVGEILERLEPREPAAPRGSLSVGAILYGESKGRSFTLEVLDEGFLCSNGSIYPSLSAAAEGASGNRRSGWAFWKDESGTPVGVVTGRFKGSC